MSLQSLQWRRLPTRIYTASFNSSFLLNQMYDMLTGSTYHDGAVRTSGSGSAWSASLKFTTGSNTEAIVCRPPFYTSISQSVIFSTKSSTAPSSSFNPIVGLSESSVYTSSVIYVTVAKNATGSFTEWTSQQPFGTGSWTTGYHLGFPGGYFISSSKLAIYESKELIMVEITNLIPNNFLGHIFAGALVDPELDFSSAVPISSSEFNGADCEIDGRLYGVATSGFTYGGLNNGGAGVYTNGLFWDYGYTSSVVAGDLVQGATLFSHQPAASVVNIGYAKFVLLKPNENDRFFVAKEPYGVRTAGDEYYGAQSGGSFLSGSLRTRSGSLAYIPYYITDPVNFKFIGRLRDIYGIRPIATASMVVKQGATTVGYSVNMGEQAAAHTMFLPYS